MIFKNEHRMHQKNYVYQQLFIVGGLEIHKRKVILEKQLRSKRHSQEDNDVMRSNLAELMFNAIRLSTPLTAALEGPTDPSSSQASTSQNDDMKANGIRTTARKNVPKAIIQAACLNKEDDDDLVARSDKDYKDKDNNLPYGVDTANIDN